MDVIFRTRKLESCYERSGYGRRRWGKEVAEAFVMRVDMLKAAADMKEIMGLPVIRCHPLKGDMKGKWSITVIGRIRLIFSLEGARMELIRIEEVSHHYGD
jgi:proteic killer suppression protein